MMVRKKKRHVLLLEVMIALMIVALCILPLLAPWSYMFFRQQEFNREVELDHLVNLLYADVVKRLYKNEILLSDLLNGTVFDVNATMLQRVGYNKYFAFRGTFTFKKEHHKPPRESPVMLYLFSLNFSFYPPKSEEPLNYHYDLFVVRASTQEQLTFTETEEPDTEGETEQTENAGS